jgi:epoxyqueuosine reductase QueG
VCPYNVKFAQELKEPAFAPREVLAGRDTRQLARDLLARTPEEFSVVFKGSPMKRAKLRGLKRRRWYAGTCERRRRWRRWRTHRCSLAHSMIPSRSCVSMRRGRFDEQDCRSAERDCRLKNCT